jgi:hypothetical protein
MTTHSESFRFGIVRTSTRGSEDDKPCAEAVPGTIQTWDYRTFKSPEEHDAKLGQKWHDRGTQHGFVYGPRGGVQGIKRRLEDRETWFVEFSTLAELMAFYEKYGDLVLSESWSDRQTPRLEIYDDYRE